MRTLVATVGTLVVVTLSLLAAAALDAVGLWLLWRWFVVPALGAPRVGFVPMMGLVCFLALARGTPDEDAPGARRRSPTRGVVFVAVITGVGGLLRLALDAGVGA